MADSWDAQRIAEEACRDHGALQKPQELAELLELLEPVAPQLIVEIGTDQGGTLWAWSQLPGPPEVIGVDLPDGPFRMGFGPGESHGAKMIMGDSHDPQVYRNVKRMLAGRKADLLFIDGDHTREGVLADWRNYSRLVRDGGLVVFHDVCRHTDESVGVRDAWEEISPRWPHVEVITPPFWWGGIGILSRSPQDAPEPVRVCR